MGNSKSIILADPDSESWDFACNVYEKIKQRDENNISIGKVEITRFNDGESYVHIAENVRGKNCFFVHDCGKNPNDWLIELMLVNDALKRASAALVTDILPYMKYSRQDRKHVSRVPVSARVIADSIGYRADRVMTTDLHADQIQGFYNKPFDNLYAFPILIKYLKEKYAEFLKNSIVIAPDAGGVHRARAFAKRIDKEIAIIDKRREKAGEVAGMNIVGEVEGKNAIIVDDMIDTGGTLIEACKALKKNGAQDVFACCTHAVFSKNAEQMLSEVFDKVIVSDSIPKKMNNNKVDIVSLAELYAEAIYRINEGLSLSELFE